MHPGLLLYPYTTQKCHRHLSRLTAPAVDSPMGPITLSNIEKAKESETEWLDKVMAALRKEELNRMDWISWSAYHPKNWDPTCCNYCTATIIYG